MLDVILDEPDGEKFLMLALKRTDERIAVGKKISPAFLFATLVAASEKALGRLSEVFDKQ